MQRPESIRIRIACRQSSLPQLASPWRAIMALVRSPGLRLRLPAHSATMLNMSSARVSMDTVGMGTSGRIHSNRRRVGCFTCARGWESAVQLARHEVIDIAPDPGLAWFDGADQGPFRHVEMPGGVPVLGGVATSYMSARQTEPKVHPGVARFEALLTALLSRMGYLDLVEMLAGFGHVQVSQVQISNAVRSHLARRAPVSYVLSKNSYRVSSGDCARRTSSYIRMNSDSSVFQLAPAGRTGCVSMPGGCGTVYE